MIELEKLVDKIDSGDIKLEEMVPIFERSTFLMNYCKNKLNQVEDRIYELINDNDIMKFKKIKK